jgi:hypothetical protein
MADELQAWTLEAKFQRNRYFYGKLLTVRDFQMEQQYFIDKSRFMNQHVAGEGVIYGLDIAPANPALSNNTITINLDSGAALDCCGNLIVVKNKVAGHEVDLPANIAAGTYYLYLIYVESPWEPVPVTANATSCKECCDYNRVLELFAVEVSSDPPGSTTSSLPPLDGKCDECPHPRVLLAVMKVVSSGSGGLSVNIDCHDPSIPRVHSNPELYSLIAGSGINGVSNPGGEITLQSDSSGSITITPDAAADTITLGTSAKQVGAITGLATGNEILQNPGGEIALKAGSNVTLSASQADHSITIGASAKTATTGVVIITLDATNGTGSALVETGFTDSKFSVNLGAFGPIGSLNFAFYGPIPGVELLAAVYLFGGTAVKKEMLAVGKPGEVSFAPISNPAALAALSAIQKDPQAPIAATDLPTGWFLIIANAPNLKGQKLAVFWHAIPAATIYLFVKTAGDIQSAWLGTDFDDRLDVLVFDSYGQVAPAGVAVIFTVSPNANGASGTFAGSPAPGGTVTVTTDDKGVAIAPVLTANNVAGLYNVTVSAVSGLPASFSVSNTAPPAAINATTGNDQNAAAGASFAANLTAAVTDANNQPVGGVAVTFIAPSSGASCSLDGQTQLSVFTNSAGVATLQNPPVANNNTGSYIVTAGIVAKAASGRVITQADFNLTNTVAPTQAPTSAPTQAPTSAPTQAPTSAPTQAPTSAPTQAPTSAPTSRPTVEPTSRPTYEPTSGPTIRPTAPTAMMANDLIAKQGQQAGSTEGTVAGLEKISGLDTASLKLLNQNKITDAASLAKAEPGSLAKLLGVSEVTAASYIDQAKGLTQ